MLAPSRRILRIVPLAQICDHLVSNLDHAWKMASTENDHLVIFPGYGINLREKCAMRGRPMVKKAVKTRPPRRNMRAADRERFIVAEAIRFFAAPGFERQTRPLAKRLALTNSAMSRHFPRPTP